MLARDRTVALDTELDNGFARRKDFSLDGQIAGIKRDAGMQIAIARMKDVAQGQTILITNLVDRGQRVGEAAAWHGDVHQVEIGGQARQ